MARSVMTDYTYLVQAVPSAEIRVVLTLICMFQHVAYLLSGNFFYGYIFVTICHTKKLDIFLESLSKKESKFFSVTDCSKDP